ncbi:MAG: hypothetical protein AB8B53_13540 [Flavobacteriales bacterium]
MTRFLAALFVSALLTSCGSETPSHTAENTSSKTNEANLENALVSMEAPVVAVSNIDKALAFTEALENGNEKALKLLVSDTLIQHNPMLKDGAEGLKALMPQGKKSNYKVEVYRAGQEEKYAFIHGLYDYNGKQAGIELFRFEDGKIAEHWSAFSPITKANYSGNSQLDGAQKFNDGDSPKSHWKIAHKFVYGTYIIGTSDHLSKTNEDFNEYASHLYSGRDKIMDGLDLRQKAGIDLKHTELIKTYGEGGLCLSVSKGTLNAKEVLIFDLFGFKDGTISDHWEVIEDFTPKTESINSNGAL